MIEAFPIPTDPGTAAAAGPIFALMALATVGVLVWQAVRYFRDNRDSRDHEGTDRDDGVDGRARDAEPRDDEFR